MEGTLLMKYTLLRMWFQMLATFACTVVLMIRTAASAEFQQLTFKLTDEPFPFSVTVLDQNRVLSLIQCCVECSKLQGPVSFVYKRAPPLCTTYRKFTPADGTPAAVQEAPDITYGIRNVQQSYMYVGCYKDNKFRVLPHNVINDYTGQTVETCMLHCHRLSYAYFGPQHGGECFCGNVIKDGYPKIPDTACNHPCPGDRSMMCGGNWAISIYKID